MFFFGFGYGLLALVNGWTTDIPPGLTIVYVHRRTWFGDWRLSNCPKNSFVPTD
jgi:hypothetical protein